VPVLIAPLSIQIRRAGVRGEPEFFPALTSSARSKGGHKGAHKAEGKGGQPESKVGKGRGKGR
jgi:hypothetical protein